MADLQSTNLTALGKARESTFGVTPASPVFKTQRQTQSGLNSNPVTVQTNEIRADRQVTDTILVGEQASGPIGGEFAFHVHDDNIEEALQGIWVNNPYIETLVADTEISDVSTTTLTVASGGAAFKTGMLALMSAFTTAANNRLARVASSGATSVVFPAATFTAQAVVNVGSNIRVVGFEGASDDLLAVTAGGNALTSTALDFTTLGILVGEWVKIGDADHANCSFAGTPANNGFARVSAVAAARLSFDIAPVGWTADAGAGKTIRVFSGDTCRNGTNKISSTFERKYLAQSPTSYEYFRGMTLNTMNIALQSQSIMTITMQYLGRDATVTTTRASGATDVAAPTYDILNTSSNFGDLMFDGVPITGPNFIQSASIDINNNLRAQNAVGSIGAIGTGNGEFSVGGQLVTYFGDLTIYQAVLANTRHQLSFRVGRPDNNRETIHIDMPSIKVTQGAPAVQGKNQDITLQGQYQGLAHPTLNYTMQFTRYWYLPTA